MIIILSKIKRVILDALFSPICVACQKNIFLSEKSICSNCLSKVKTNNTLFCPVCRARIPENKKICHFNCPYLLGAASDYDDPTIQNVIHFLKYKKVKSLSAAVAEVIWNYLKNLNLNLENFTIVPVPLHKRKEFSRGFNQAGLIAEHISRTAGVPFLLALERIKNNKPQAGLKGLEKRGKNIRDCFAIKNPQSVSGKNVILVDDVFTSGATMNEAVKILKSCGAKKIIALVAAKA